MPGAQDKGTEGWREGVGGGGGGGRGVQGRKQGRSKRGGWCKKREREAGSPTMPGTLSCSRGFAAPVPHYSCPMCPRIHVSVFSIRFYMPTYTYACIHRDVGLVVSVPDNSLRGTEHHKTPTCVCVFVSSFAWL